MVDHVGCRYFATKPNMGPSWMDPGLQQWIQGLRGSADGLQGAEAELATREIDAASAAYNAKLPKCAPRYTAASGYLPTAFTKLDRSGIRVEKSVANLKRKRHGIKSSN